MFEQQDAPSTNPSTPSFSGSPVLTFPTTDAVQASTVRVQDCGLRALELFANYDLGSSSWRTSQRCFLGGWTEYSGTWPRSGTMRSGSVYRRETLVSRMSETASSSRHGANGRPLYRQEASPNVNAAMTSGASDALPTTSSVDALGLTLTEMTGTSRKRRGVPSPTLTASEWRGVGPNGSKSHCHMLERGYLGPWVQEVEGKTGKLNPDWCDAWMGFPVGYSCVSDPPLGSASPNSIGSLRD